MDYILEGTRQAIQLLLSCDSESYSAIFTTIKTSSLSILLSMIIGMPAGFMLGYAEFPGRRQIRAVFDTLLALPTVVVGLLVYAFISRRGLLGDFELLYTIYGIVIAQTILILPIVISLTATAIESLDARVIQTISTLGAERRHLLLSLLYEARFAVISALITAYGRAVSEVGISMMIGGNIKWYTRTMTTAIALETGKGEFAMGIALGIVLLGMVFLINILLLFLKRFKY